VAAAVRTPLPPGLAQLVYLGTVSELRQVLLLVPGLHGWRRLDVPFAGGGRGGGRSAGASNTGVVAAAAGALPLTHPGAGAENTALPVVP
jgi:hypothetical protein